MKNILRLLFIILLLALSFPSKAHVQMLQAVISGGGAAASCQATPFYDSYATTSSYIAFGNDNTNNAWAGNLWTATASKSICKAELELKVGGGNLNGKTYYVEIWTPLVDGTSSLPSSVVTNGTASISCASGSCAWGTGTTVAFTWSGSYPTVTSGTIYGITISPHAEDTTNFAGLNIASQSSSATQFVMRWKSTKAYGAAYAAYIGKIKLYAYE